MSKEAMKRFLIDTPVNNAEGSQVWYVDAASEAEAMEKYKQGECDLYASEVDVTSLGEPEISGETTLDDFGDFADQPAHQEPVAAECKFDREQRWVRCEIAHHNLVQSEPHNWQGYQTRLLYTTPQPPAQPLTDEQIDKAAMKLAECMDYPWAQMPEQGKQSMRIHAKAVIEASGITKGGAA